MLATNHSALELPIRGRASESSWPFLQKRSSRLEVGGEKADAARLPRLPSRHRRRGGGTSSTEELGELKVVELETVAASPDR